jgi:hypothetical protein
MQRLNKGSVDSLALPSLAKLSADPRPDLLLRSRVEIAALNEQEHYVGAHLLRSERRRSNRD